MNKIEEYDFKIKECRREIDDAEAKIDKFVDIGDIITDSNRIKALTTIIVEFIVINILIPYELRFGVSRHFIGQTLTILFGSNILGRIAANVYTNLKMGMFRKPLEKHVNSNIDELMGIIEEKNKKLEELEVERDIYLKEEEENNKLDSVKDVNNFVSTICTSKNNTKFLIRTLR